MGSYYKREVPDIGLSVERATENVPDDDLFYLLKDGQVLESFANEKAAVTRFQKMLTEIGYEPPKPGPDTPLTPREEALRRHFDRMEIFWSDSHKHQRKGGKGKA